jgi:hypothetical protein
MAYSGTTAATTASNPPIQIARGVGNFNPNIAVVGSTASMLAAGGGAGLWLYQSVDGSTLTEVPGYFTDGGYLGMKNGDVLIGVNATSVGSTTVLLYMGILQTTSTFGSTTFGLNGPAFGLSTGGTMTSSFN